MKLNQFITTAVAAVAISAAASSAVAQNANYAPGDLLIGFRNTGGVTGASSTVLVNLGAAFTYRDNFTNGTNVNNIINIGSLLTSTFGASWFDTTTLTFGLAGVYSNDPNDPSVTNGDPTRTIYTSKSRVSVGTIGVKNSGGNFANLSNTNLNTGSTGVTNLGNVLETQYTTGAEAIPTSTANTWEDFTIQTSDFGVFGAGGIEQAFAAGDVGDYGIGIAEGAVDYFRFNGVAPSSPSFQGTFTIDSTGNIDYVVSAVPEPSTYAFMSLGALGLFAAFRRSRKQSV